MIADQRLTMSTVDSLGSLDTPTLRREFARVLAETAENLSYLAAIYLEMERRGEAPKDLRGGLLSLIPDIAHGKLAPEAALAFGGSVRKAFAVSRLPVNMQKSLASGERVQVAVPTGSDGFQVRKLQISELSVREVESIISDGRILSPSEQAADLAPRPESMRAVSVMLSEREFRKLEKLAHKRTLTTSAMLRFLVLEAVEAA